MTNSRAGLWSLAAGPRDPKAHFILSEGRDQFLTQLTAVSEISQTGAYPLVGEADPWTNASALEHRARFWAFRWTKQGHTMAHRFLWQ